MCDSCPINTDSAQQSGLLSDCVAIAGYTGSGISISICDAGTYKASVSAAACSKCSKGQFGQGQGQTSEISACTACDANTFQNSTGHTDCFNCPTGSGTGGLGGQDDVEDCEGSAGHTGRGIEVRPCVPGTYKEVGYSAAACDACPTGKFGTQPGQVSGTAACMACPPGSYAAVPALTVCEVCPPNSNSSMQSDALSDCLAQAEACVPH